MVLTTTVIKKSVTQMMNKMWNITLNMTLKDGTTEVFNQDYSVGYRTGDSVTSKVTAFITLMQVDIDKYKTEQQLFTSTQLNTAVVDIQTGLVI